MRIDTEAKKGTEGEKKRGEREGEGGRVAKEDANGGHKRAAGMLEGPPRPLLPPPNLDRERDTEKRGRERKSGRGSGRRGHRRAFGYGKIASSTGMK